MHKPVIAITIGKSHYKRMFANHAWDTLGSFANIIHHLGEEPATKDELLTLLSQADGCITSWGVAALDEDVISAAPKLRVMAHMGSSVQRFVSDAVWERGMQVTSAGPALAIDVAETTLGLMIVGLKRVWQFGQVVRRGGWRDDPSWPARELYSKTVGIIGASNVGRHVIKLLQQFTVDILVYDPYLSNAEAHLIGAHKVDLEELLERADVVSLHAPANESTYHMLDSERFEIMKDDALIINTARGSLINEQSLIKELSKGRFFAFLDVTDPEPPGKDSPLRVLQNVVVIPHIAGCIENCGRMGDMAIEELRRFFSHERPLYPITREQLARISS